MAGARLVRQLVTTLLLTPLAAFGPVTMFSRPRQQVPVATAGQLLRKRRSGWLRLNVFRRSANGETRLAERCSVFIGAPES